ncbi:MAG: tyrosine-type recombinase/integrase [Microgenomates group bacterium]
MDTNLETLLANFVEYLKKSKKSTFTILSYSNDLSQLISFLKERRIAQINSVSSQDIEDFKSSLENKKYTPKSVFRKLNSIRSFFRWLKNEKIIKEDPSLTVTYPKIKPSIPRVLTETEYRALRDAVREDARMALVVELLLQTGMRIGELERLQLDDFSEKEIRIRAYETNPERTVPLNSAIKKALVRWLNIRPKTENKFLLVTKTGRPFLVRNIRASLQRYLKKAGIKNASVHSLRHTFIVHQLAAGVPIPLVQKVVGHRSVTTTEKYLEFVPKTINNSIPNNLEEL